MKRKQDRRVRLVSAVRRNNEVLYSQWGWSSLICYEWLLNDERCILFSFRPDEIKIYRYWFTVRTGKWKAFSDKSSFCKKAEDWLMFCLGKYLCDAYFIKIMHHTENIEKQFFICFCTCFRNSSGNLHWWHCPSIPDFRDTIWLFLQCLLQIAG